MSEFIYANLQRAGTDSTPYAKNVYLQLSKMDARESADYAGADVHFTHRMYTRQLPIDDVTLVQQGDLVVDTNQTVLDPKTGKPRQFRIISDPSVKTLMMSYQWVATRYRGT